MALVESRHKAAALEELQRRLDAADFVVTPQFFVNLVGLAVDVEQPIDVYAARQGQQSQEELARRERQRAAIQPALWLKYFEAAWAAAEDKPPVVRASSLLQLFKLRGDTGRGFAIPFPPERQQSLRAAVLPVFARLPPSDQSWLLESNWRRLGGADWLPALRAFVAIAPERDRDSGGPVILDSVFKRHAGAVPEEARSLILTEIRRPTPRATDESLTRLPAEPIPDLDDLLADRLEKSLGDLDDAVFAARLVAHYGSPAIRGRVREAYGDHGGKWACAIQAGLLAYFLRHDPKEGPALLKQAISERRYTGCYRTVLSDVARIGMSPALERAAIEHLDDADREIAANAADALGAHGSPAAEQSLWDAMKKWRDAWRDRAGELNVVVNGSQVDPQVRLEQALVHALARSNVWIADQQKLERLRALCITRHSQDDVGRCLEAWRGPVAIRFSPGADSELARQPRCGTGLVPSGRQTTTPGLWHNTMPNHWPSSKRCCSGFRRAPPSACRAEFQRIRRPRSGCSRNWSSALGLQARSSSSCRRTSDSGERGCVRRWLGCELRYFRAE